MRDPPTTARGGTFYKSHHAGSMEGFDFDAKSATPMQLTPPPEELKI